MTIFGSYILSRNLDSTTTSSKQDFTPRPATHEPLTTIPTSFLLSSFTPAVLAQTGFRKVPDMMLGGMRRVRGSVGERMGGGVGRDEWVEKDNAVKGEERWVEGTGRGDGKACEWMVSMAFA
ncbi:hypothetical protein HDU97_001444 [Phlyctochytrium planicorne]|nr:hypothetical protein HDU97_001444 [Phlyctochytrium planicorne]